MFYWKPTSATEDISNGYLGWIYEDDKDGREEFALDLYINKAGNYYSWIWNTSAVSPEEFLSSINWFIESSEPPFATDRATILISNLDPRWRDRTVPLPLQIVDGTFDGLKVADITLLRIDVPEPAKRPPPTVLSSGESCTVPPIGVLGISFFGRFDVTGDVHLALFGSFVPAEQIAEFYARTSKRALSNAEFASLVEIIRERSRIPTN